MNKYVEMNTFVSNNAVDIKNIDDFEDVIQEYAPKNIFYGQRTARNIEGKCFLINIHSTFFVFTYNSRYGSYKTISDYKDGINRKYKNAMDYYICLKNQIAIDFEEYLVNEYDFNRARSQKNQEYSDEMMNIIFEL